MLDPVPIDPKYGRRLSPQKAAELRQAKEAGATYAEITMLYGISRQAAVRIVKRRSHRNQKHVSDLGATR